MKLEVESTPVYVLRLSAGEARYIRTALQARNPEALTPECNETASTVAVALHDALRK